MTFSKVSRLLVIFSGVIAFTCKDDVVDRSYPSVDTHGVSEITQNGATFNAVILNLGTAGISDHGFVYSERIGPTLQDSERISLGETIQEGGFSTLANRNLTKNKTYYVKAYAITKNKDIAVYGNEVEFISLGGKPPEIKNFSPLEGSCGDTVLLTGFGFSTVLTNNWVKFSDNYSQVIKATTDSVWCLVPGNIPRGLNEVSIQVGQSRVAATSKFLLKSISLSSFNPLAVSFGDTLRIRGINFPVQQNITRISFLGKNLFPMYNSTNELRVVIPNDVVTPNSPLIISAGSQTLTHPTEIILLPPIIASVSPLKATKNTEVLITGNHFSPIILNNKVELNGISLAIIENTTTTLKVRIPSGIPPGSYPLSVTVATQDVSSSTPLEIIKPTITNVTPLRGTWGETVTLTGENFGNSISDNIVKFDNVVATILSASSTEIKVSVPNNLLKKNSSLTIQSISIDNLSATHTEPFLLEPPAITGFFPAEGKSKTQVTITGTNFNPTPNNQVVKFGDKNAVIISSTPTQLVVQVPTSIAESDVAIQLSLAEQATTTSLFFHLISPWKKLQDFPGAGRSNATTFTLGGLGYLGLGTEPPTFSKRFWKYTPQSDSWIQLGIFSFPNEGLWTSFSNMISFSNGSNAFVGIGRKDGYDPPEGRIRKFDPITETWSDAMAIDQNAVLYGVDGAVAYSIGGKGYVTTGAEKNRVLSSKMWEYTPELDSWSRKTDFPGPARWEASGFSIGTKAYLLGGETCSFCGNYLADFWEYDAITDTWIQLQDFPGLKRSNATSFTINGIGYLIGGTIRTMYGDSQASDFWKFDPNSKSWTQLEDFPGGKKTGAAVFVIDGKVYFGTGYGSTGNGKDFWEFDPSKL